MAQYDYLKRVVRGFDKATRIGGYPSAELRLLDYQGQPFHKTLSNGFSSAKPNWYILGKVPTGYERCVTLDCPPHCTVATVD